VIRVTDIANTIAEISAEGAQFEFYELMGQDHSGI